MIRARLGMTAAIALGVAMLSGQPVRAECGVFEKLGKLVRDQFGVAPGAVKRSATLKRDLGADALDLVEFTMEVEEAFGIAIANAEADRFRNLGDVEALICRKMKRR